MPNPSPSLSPNKFSGIINKQKKLFTNLIDAVLADDGCTTECILYFNNLDCIICENCVFNPVTGTSSGSYNGSGPVPFGKGMICPVCGGAGKIQVGDTEYDINLAVIFDSKKFYGYGKRIVEESVQSANMYAQTMCRIELYNEIKKAKEAVLNSIMGSYSHNKYKRVSEPEPIGFGTPQYIITTWQLVQP